VNPSADPVVPQQEALLAEEARTRRALLHMLEDLQRERDVVRKAKRHWLDTVDAIDAPLLVHDEEFRVVRANRAYARQAGMDFEEIIGRPYWECFPRIAQAPQGMPAEFALPTGESFSVRSFPVKEGDEKGVAWLHLFEDVTKKRRVDEQIRVLQDISASEFILKGEVEAVARQVTESAARLTGVARANVWLFNEAEDELRCIDLYETKSGSHSSGMVLRESEFANEFAALKSAPYVAVHEPLTDPRTRGYVESYLKPLGITSMLDTVVEVSGKHIGLLCLEHVGKRHQWRPDEIAFAARLADKIAVAFMNRGTLEAQVATQRRERYYRKLIEGSADAFFVIDRAGRLLYRSESGTRLTGHKAEDVMGKDLTTFVVPGSLDEARRAIGEAIAQPDKPSHVELRIVRADGELLDVEATGKNHLADPDVNGIIVTARDISARKRTEDLLRDSEKKFRSVTESAIDAIVIMDNDGQVVEWNCAAERIFGYTAPEAAGKNLHGLVTPARYHEAFARGFAGFRSTGQGAAIGRTLEMIAQRKNGEEFPVDLSLSPALLKGKWHAIGIVRDTSERKAAERAMRESEEKFRAIFDHTRDGILVMEIAAQSVKFANPSMESLLGYAPGELSGAHISRLHPADALAEVAQRFGEASGGRTHAVQGMQMLRKDGQTVYVDLKGTAVEIGGSRYLLGAFRDATERRASEARLQRLNRALRTLSAGNEALVRATDEAGLLNEMSRILH